MVDWKILPRSVAEKLILSKMVFSKNYFIIFYGLKLELAKNHIYFLGSGLEDINGVFEESNTYQPSVPSTEAEIIVRFTFVLKESINFSRSKNIFRFYKKIIEMWKQVYLMNS